jgi:hypothetical protein
MRIGRDTGRWRYRIEQLFDSIKQKIGSSFKLLREDLARKASIACAILWNFWVFATYLFLLFLSNILRLSKNFYNLIVISYKIIPKNLKIRRFL